MPANDATPEGVGDRDGICAGWAGIPEPGPLMAQRQEFARLIAGGEQLRAVAPCRDKPAHRDTLVVRADGRLQLGCPSCAVHP